MLRKVRIVKLAKGRTVVANKVRSARAASLDERVFDAIGPCLAREWGEIPAGTDLTYFGFPEFHSSRWVRNCIAESLNERGITAPRGGKWNVRQVHRALVRCAGRMSAEHTD